ncbi:hypothetical protein LD001_05765 [Pseudomonas kurunegalensis]|uniref:hypothetical protein n=1 Tax=Pseudomonas kurunegalensis TaxID=485880 RepID=UPI001CDC5AC5|nr:hypothetical protein [Pseudomonas kurunegalensis]MCA4074837.1 hypothetical protein [Pseudomonas kurunegalensis]
MQQRQEGFFQFFEKYPAAERHEHRHENGYYSTVSVGLFQGLVDGAFIGIYDEHGRLRREENLPWDVVESRFGRDIGPAELLAKLTENAVVSARSRIVS